MVAYYASLLARAFLKIPYSLGSNWLGLLFPVFVVLCGEAIACLYFGWRIVIAKWKRATGIGFGALGVCYTLLFAWCAATTNYTDYSGLRRKADSLQASADTAEARQQYALLKAQSECAQTLGENIALGKQNRDQQGTINNCQTQALRLLIPQPFSYAAMALDESHANGQRNARWLIVTNKSDTPVSLNVTCAEEILEIDSAIVGQQTISRASPLNTKEWLIQISSPAWTPVAPFLIHSTTRVSTDHLTCDFHVTGGPR